MASLSTGSDGLHKVYFKGGNGKRQCLYCGRIPKKAAEGIERCMTDLERCRASGGLPGPATASWLGEISAEWHAKLASHRLTQQRAAEVEAPAIQVVTLGDLIARYKTRPKWRKKTSAGQRTAEVTFAHLLRFFGSDRDIAAITETDAEDLAGFVVEPKPLGAGLSEATGAAIINAGSAIMRFATRSRLVPFNPFAEIKRGSYATARKAFVEVATVKQVIDALPCPEMRLLLALSRWGGLRTPSEHRVLTWADIDWENNRFTVNSPKTGPRLVPIFPELLPYLRERFEAAEDGDMEVLTSMKRSGDSAFSKRVERTVEKLGMERWPRTFHNLRSSRQTELTERFPSHVVASWLGNSVAVADRHYLQVMASHFDAATQPLHNPLQQVPATTDKRRKSKSDCGALRAVS